MTLPTAALPAAATTSAEAGRITREFRAMASPCRLVVDGADPADPRLVAALDEAEDEVRRLERHWSRYRPDSVISRINAAAGNGRTVPLDAETAGLLAFADQLHLASQGRFDISSGVLRRVWDFKAEAPPEAAAVEALLPLVDWPAVRWDEHGVSLPRPGMELDLGGLGKEYAADRAATLLMEHGFVHGHVNLGGDLRLLGPQRDGQPWRLGVAHPRQPGAVIAELALGRGALATSGDYERAIVQAGRRWCHILDARTGWPVHTWQSVSVIAPACLAAGALSTLAMLLGPQAPGFLQAQGVSHLLVGQDGQIIKG